MKKFCLFIILSVNLLLSQTLPLWNGISVATSDNLDATTFNPAGLGVKRGSIFGISVRNLQSNADSPYITAAFASNNFTSMIYTDTKGDYRYSFGFGFPIDDFNSYMGIQYFTEKILKTGLLIRPWSFLSLGYANNHYFDVDIKQHTLGFGLRPFGNRLTLGMDFNNTIIENDVNNDYQFFTEFRPIDGLNVKAAYNPDLESYNLSAAIDLGNLETVFGYSESDKSMNHLAVQSYSQERKSLIDIFKSPHNKKTYIEMPLSGIFIEEPEKKDSPFDLNINVPLLRIDNNNYIQLRKWISGVHKIAADPNIDGIVIYLNGIGGGFSKLMEARNALQKCKDNGKKIIVYATGISNSNYYLVSLADEIYINKLSAVNLKGLNFEVTFYKELADSLSLVYEVEKISNYKSALDQWTRTSMSDEMKKNMGGLLDDIYNEFITSIATSKNWTEDEVKSIIDQGPFTSKQAVKHKLVTKLMYPDEFNSYKKKLKTDFITFSKYNTDNVYAYDWKPDAKKEKIAIIYAVGGINLGNSVRKGRGASTVMGHVTIAKAIANAREDKNIKAIILRIDSGGGSALASDLIWREIKKTTAPGKNQKPVIASMSDMAASGGYYIACQADTIVANSTTITGSIGIISGRLNFSGLLEKIGLHTDRMVYGENAAIYSNRKLWNDNEKKKIHDQMIDTYGEFLSRVAMGRKELDSLAADKVGIGQVWSGAKARDHKLVDILGGLDKSIKIAAQMAKIPKSKELLIVEYPKNIKMSILKKNKFNKIEWQLSGGLQEFQEMINSIPNFNQDPMQMMIPCKIEIK